MAAGLLSLLVEIAGGHWGLPHGLETAAVLFHQIGSCEIGHLLTLDN
jgi:hypothetical protein